MVLRVNRHLFWSHTRDDGDRFREDGHSPTWLKEEKSACVTWCMNAFVYTETRKEFFTCCWTQWQKDVVHKDKMDKFYDKRHRRRAIRAMAPRRKHVSTVRGLARTYLAGLKDKIPSSDVTTHSPTLPWTNRYAAWVLTRYNVRWTHE